MITIQAQIFFAIAALVEQSRVVAKTQKPSSVPENKEMLTGTLELALNLCNQNDLALSIRYINKMLEEIKKEEEYTYGKYTSEMAILYDRIVDELETVSLLRLPPHLATFYGDDPHFGQDVANKFSKATSDIQEGAKCLALGRTTASVFHLMRVMEFAVQYLGRRLNIDLVNEKNWHNILDEVDKAIKGLPTKTSRQKGIRNRFAEASAHLRMVKDAWRNDVMHPKETYTEEEAERVFRNVKDFMIHLATKL
jgi:HEPN domain-containing protein